MVKRRNEPMPDTTGEQTKGEWARQGQQGSKGASLYHVDAKVCMYQIFALSRAMFSREDAERVYQIFAPLRLCERCFHATTRRRKEGVSNLCAFASLRAMFSRGDAKRVSQIFAPLRLCERYFHATTRSRKEGVSNLRAFASLRQIFTWSCGVFHVKINFFSYIMTNTTLLTDTNRVFEHPILLFDGVCNLCNAAVVTVLRHDKAGVFRFAALQSATGQKLLGAHGLSVQNLDSVVMIDGQKVYLRSDVPLEVARRLHGFWPLLTVFGLIPRSVRDAVYSFIARNRYRWWGHRETCMVPDAALRHRFYD